MKSIRLGGKLNSLFWSAAYCPFGLVTGFFTVTFIYKITHEGLSATDAAFILSAPCAINWLKWMWAPLVDACKRMKLLYLAMNALACLLLIASLKVHASKENLVAILVIVTGANLFNSITGMVVEALVAQIPNRKILRESTVWMQGGGLLGSGIGGAFGLFALSRFASEPALVGLFLATISGLASLAIFRIARVERRERIDSQVLSNLKTTWAELKRLLSNRNGRAVGLLCVLPLGTGVAEVILTQAQAAQVWHVGGSQIAWIQGLFVGLLTPLGSVLGAPLYRQNRPSYVYVASGFGLALVAAAMALFPKTPFNYALFCLIYATLMGLSYGAFSAMVISIVGKHSAASGYNLFASLANFPIWAMNLILGWTTDHYSVGTMLLTEAGAGLVASFIFMIALAYLGPAVNLSRARQPQYV